jgi:hypothetical protein
MTFKELKLKIKEEQKDLAQKIKELKGKRKQVPDGYVDGLWNYRNIYRHTHIAYCQFFNNTPYALIEQPRDDNKPVTHRLDKLKQDWEVEIDEEALRDCA